jgi:undecaprenol kinase
MRCALNGILYALLHERNLRVQLAVFVVAISAAYLLKISRIDFLIIIVMSALVISLELANTAIEKLADRVLPEQDLIIGRVKDLMAGAVLLASIFSLIIGFSIFYTPVLKLLFNKNL